ncbi:MAG: sugar ABC transporter ATP-binding protein [candidate division WS1 bacterium]|nr:sugar ABC transporter ATP-binding protein [candidate division WS1 bacterium]
MTSNTSERDPILVVDGTSKSFGGVRALRSVSFSALPGEIHALVGENGAGKSTLMKILAGNITADQGSITFEGRTVQFSHPRDAQAAGIAIVHQELSLAPNMSIAENVFVGREPTIRLLGFVNRRELYQRTTAALDQLGLRLDPWTKVSDIDVAMRQMVEIARAISFDCRVLILDEPTSALADQEIEALFAVLRRLAERGVAIIYISHKLNEVFALADRVTVLRDGQWVGSKLVSETDPDEVIRMMVGRNLEQLFPAKGSARVPEPILEVRGLSRGKAFTDVSFDLHPGEIVGLAGLVGAGRTEVARAIFGADPITGGTIKLEGRPARIANPQQAIERGVLYLPEDRKLHGLFPDMSIRANIVAATLGDHSKVGMLLPSAQQATTDRMVERLDIKVANTSASVSSLSGGNQQKAMFGKWLAATVKVFLVDEPTRGIDVSAKAEVHALLRDLADQGVAILLVSSELPEVIGASDRVLVMHEGQIAGEVSGAEMTEENIMRLATGQTRGTHTHARGA